MRNLATIANLGTSQLVQMKNLMEVEEPVIEDELKIGDIEQLGREKTKRDMFKNTNIPVYMHRLTTKLKGLVREEELLTCFQELTNTEKKDM